MAAVQFAVAPSFSHITLSDSSSVDDALRYVLAVRKKADVDNKIVQKITDQTKSSTVGDLRRLTDGEWRSLDVPALCRIYLKFLVRQSSRGGPLAHPSPALNGAASSSSSSSSLSSSSSASSSSLGSIPSQKSSSEIFFEQLSSDFNYGQPFDLSLYTPHISVLASMGFKKEESMEALCITENKGVESALEVLFISDMTIRAKRRVDAVEKFGRQAGNTNSPLLSVPNGSVRTSENNALMLQNFALQNDITALRQQIDRERSGRMKVETELRAHMENFTRSVYKEYVRGLLADESLNLQEIEQLKIYREKRKITQQDHLLCLQELGMSEKQFDSLKNYNLNMYKKGENECVVCLDKPKTHVILSCMHLCLCEDCVPTVSKRNSKCPMCSKRITSISRIYT